MSTQAIIMMVLGCVSIFGGFVGSIVFAAVKSKN